MDWFTTGKVASVLIIDDCNRILSDEKQKKTFFKFRAMIQSNEKGKIIITSNERLNLVPFSSFRCFDFSIGNLLVEASIKVLQHY